MEQIEDFPGVVRIPRVVGEGLEAALAQARRFKFLRHEMQDVGGNRRSITPAASLVGLSCCDTTLIWIAANGATALAVGDNDLALRRGWMIRHVVFSR